MTAESRADLDAWLAADTRHRGAYIRACAWLRATEVAVIASRSPGPIIPSRASDNDNDRIEPGTLRRLASRWSGRAVAGGEANAMSLAKVVAVGVTVQGLVTRPAMVTRHTENGRASSRAGVCQYVKRWVAAVA